MLYGNLVKSTLEDVRLVLPRYIFEISDVNEALDPINRGGNCAAITYMGLVALEERLGGVPGFLTQFGFDPHVEKPCGAVIVGHALGRFEIGGLPYIFNQARDGTIRIGKPSEFKISDNTSYYPTEEGYRLFLDSLCNMRSDDAPAIVRDDVVEVYRRALEARLEETA